MTKLPHRSTTAQPTWTVQRGHKLAPSAGIEVESKAPAKAHEPADADGRPRALASYVEGLHALAMRPPKFEQIELAVDGQGGLHVLGHEADLRILRRVEQWAASHREILAMAAGDHFLDVSNGKVTSHLFTEQPAQVADLHEAGIRLHVLAPVDMENQRGWYSAPLNTSID
jgi:hypothetical protein